MNFLHLQFSFASVHSKVKEEERTCSTLRCEIEYLNKIMYGLRESRGFSSGSMLFA